MSDGLGNQLSWQQIHANLTRRGLLDPIMLCCAASSDSLSCIADLWPHATMEIFDIDHYDMWKHVCDRIMPNVSSSEPEAVLPRGNLPNHHRHRLETTHEPVGGNIPSPAHIKRRIAFRRRDMRGK